MRIKWLWNNKDGGAESFVWCYGLEIKSLFSLMLLRFEKGGREVYHSHAFDCISWVLSGRIDEEVLNEPQLITYEQSFKPIITKRNRIHRVFGIANTTWVITFRSRWADTWEEQTWGTRTILTHGRRVVDGN